MQYAAFSDLKLSTLGFGLMRLPVLDGDDARIDVQPSAEMVEYAFSHGVNYFDTAWGTTAAVPNPPCRTCSAAIRASAIFSPPSFPATT